MAKFYTNLTSGDTVNSINANGGTYGIACSQDVDCSKVTASGEVKCTSTTAPFYPPVVTTTQRNSMTVTKGAMVFNSTTNKLNVYNGTSWEVVTSA